MVRLLPGSYFYCILGNHLTKMYALFCILQVVFGIPGGHIRGDVHIPVSLPGQLLGRPVTPVFPIFWAPPIFSCI